LTAIGDACFAGCEKLRSVTIESDDSGDGGPNPLFLGYGAFDKTRIGWWQFPRDRVQVSRAQIGKFRAVLMNDPDA
jgi:hypothetical protein